MVGQCYWGCRLEIEYNIAAAICCQELRDLSNFLQLKDWDSAELKLIEIKTKIGYNGNVYQHAAADLRMSKFKEKIKKK